MAQEIGRTPLWYHGWNIVAGCILISLVSSALLVNSFSLFLSPWSRHFDVPISTLQLGMGMFAIMSALLAPLVGALADRWPVRHLFAIGLIGIALANLAMGFATEVWQYLVIYAVIVPLAIDCTTSLPANVIVMRWFNRRRGFVLGLTSLGLAAGGVIAPAFITVISVADHWQTIWRGSAVLIGLVVLPLAWLVMRDRTEPRDGESYILPEMPADVNQGDKTEGGLRWRDIVRRRNFWLLIAPYVTLVAAYGGCLQNLAPIVTSRGLSEQAAGQFVALLSLSHSIMTVVAGWLSDRIGNRMTIIGLAIVTAAGTCLMALAPGTTALAVGILLAGSSGGLWPPLAAAFATEFGEKGFGQAYGLASAFLPITAFTPFAVAKIQELSGSYVPGLIILTGMCLAGGLACASLDHHRRPQHTQK